MTSSKSEDKGDLASDDDSDTNDADVGVPSTPKAPRFPHVIAEEFLASLAHFEGSAGPHSEPFRKWWLANGKSIGDRALAICGQFCRSPSSSDDVEQQLKAVYRLNNPGKTLPKGDNNAVSLLAKGLCSSSPIGVLRTVVDTKVTTQKGKAFARSISLGDDVFAEGQREVTILAGDASRSRCEGYKKVNNLFSLLHFLKKGFFFFLSCCVPFLIAVLRQFAVLLFSCDQVKACGSVVPLVLRSQTKILVWQHLRMLIHLNFFAVMQKS